MVEKKPVLPKMEESKNYFEKKGLQEFEGEYPIIWILKAEIFFWKHKIHSAHWLQWAFMRMKEGDILRWFISWYEENPDQDWESFSTVLLEQYGIGAKLKRPENSRTGSRLWAGTKPSEELGLQVIGDNIASGKATDCDDLPKEMHAQIEKEIYNILMDDDQKAIESNDLEGGQEVYQELVSLEGTDPIKGIAKTKQSLETPIGKEAKMLFTTESMKTVSSEEDDDKKMVEPKNLKWSQEADQDQHLFSYGAGICKDLNHEMDQESCFETPFAKVVESENEGTSSSGCLSNRDSSPLLKSSETQLSLVPTTTPLWPELPAIVPTVVKPLAKNFSQELQDLNIQLTAKTTFQRQFFLISLLPLFTHKVVCTPQPDPPPPKPPDANLLLAAIESSLTDWPEKQIELDNINDMVLAWEQLPNTIHYLSNGVVEDKGALVSRKSMVPHVLLATSRISDITMPLLMNIAVLPHYKMGSYNQTVNPALSLFMHPAGFVCTTVFQWHLTWALCLPQWDPGGGIQSVNKRYNSSSAMFTTEKLVHGFVILLELVKEKVLPTLAALNEPILLCSSIKTVWMTHSLEAEFGSSSSQQWDPGEEQYFPATLRTRLFWDGV